MLWAPAYKKKSKGRSTNTGPSQVENINLVRVKFIYSEKATKFCKISTLLLTGTTQDKSKVEFPQNFAAFSEYMNFTKEGREDYSENLFPWFIALVQSATAECSSQLALARQSVLTA